MTVKFSAISAAGAILGTDTLIGVQAGPTDVQYTYANAAAYFWTSPVLTGTTTTSGDKATPAGGSTTAVLLFGTTAGFGIYYGSGVPTVTAAQGSLYLRSDGSTTNNRVYVNTTGSTTWTALVTVA